MNEIWDNKKQLKNFASKRFKFEQEEDLDDFVTDVLYKATIKIHLFNPEKSKLTTWINNIAVRHYIDKYVRKKKVEGKYRPVETTSTINTTIDLEGFEDFLSTKDKDLQTLYYLRKKDIEVDDILLSMNINIKQYKLLFKELKNLRDEFFKEV